MSNYPAWLLLAAATGLAVGGCTTTPANPPPVSPSSLATPTASPTSTGRAATMVRVVDGDTIVVADPASTAKTTTVRIVGINTPETKAPGKPVECYGPQAAGYLEGRLAAGDPVQLVPDPTQDDKDRYGRTLAYVEDVGNSGAVDIGLEMIRKGYAHAYKVSGPAPSRWTAYEAAQRDAQTAKIGGWAVCSW